MVTGRIHPLEGFNLLLLNFTIPTLIVTFVSLGDGFFFPFGAEFSLHPVSFRFLNSEKELPNGCDDLLSVLPGLLVG